MSAPTTLKVVLGEQRPFGNPQVAVSQGMGELRAFLNALRPAFVQQRIEESIPFLVTIGAGLGPFQRPKDTARPVIVGIVCAIEEWSRVQHTVEEQLKTLPGNVFLILYCVEDARQNPLQRAFEILHGQCRVVQPRDLQGRRAAAFRGEIRAWRSTL